MKTLARPEDKARILGRLRDVRPDSVHRWGRMSAHQMVCHLGDSFRMALGRKQVRCVDRASDRTVLKWVVLYVPVSWPAGIHSSPELDQELQGTRPVTFAEDVAELEALLELITSRPTDFVWPRHPLFGPLSGAAWLRWGYLHLDHHLRQFGS